LEVDAARQRGRSRRTWKEVVDKDVDDLYIKPRDAVRQGKVHHTPLRQCRRVLISLS